MKARNEFDNVEYCNDAYQCLENSQVAVILTEWNQFRALDLDRVGQLLGDRLLIDLRNIYSREEVNSHGLEYISIGRPNG